MATLTLTATPEPAAVPPRVRLDITDSGTPAVTSVVISRLDSDGRYRPVRTSDGGPLPISGGVATIYDYEPLGYGTPVTYSTNQAGGPTVTAVLDSGVPWLVHPGLPSRSVPISISSQDDETFDVAQGIFDILEREDPIVVTGGARSTAASTFGIRTRTSAERRALRLLLSDASPLLLNMPAAMDWGIDPCYITVGTVRRGRTVRYGPFPYREWQLPYRVVGRPAGGTQAAIAWDNIATRGADDYTAAAGSQYLTWQAIADAHVPSWAELSAPTT